jgi:tRNA pseudouridine55 synthase
VSDANRDPIGTPDLYAAPDLPASFDRVVLPIDKPFGLSSFGVIRRLRRILGVRKIGHAGTLDPMATGLLIMLVGRATKQMEHFMGMPKVYTGIIRLGETTPSYDAETEVVERRPTAHLSEQDIITATTAFTGDIEQLPPMYSAVKVGGERLYKKARRGEEIERRPRQVRVDRFDITKVDGPDVHFEVACSKGTYIRSLANDLGQALEVGGHLVALRRTSIGDLSVDTAWTLDALAEALPTSESRE